MSKSKRKVSKEKVVKILAAAGIAFHGVVTADVAALAKALESGSPTEMNLFISKYSDSEYVGDAVIYLAENRGKAGAGNGRFKEPGDLGRPDNFGDPGVPDIGPPGQYEG